MADRIAPIFITDKDTGEKYELDFNREAVYFMDQQKFPVNEEMFSYPSNWPKLFYYSFRANHRRLSKAQTDALIAKMGGLTAEIVQRLVELYIQAATSNVIQDKEDLAANPHVTVEL